MNSKKKKRRNIQIKRENLYPKPLPPVPPIGHPPYNVNGEGGRPPKWTSGCLDELASSLDAWIDQAVKTNKEFWWQDWAFQVGTNPKKISEFADRHPRFRESYERAREWQQHIVQKGALIKKLSEGFSKFFLINRYSDEWKSDKSDETRTPPKDKSNDIEHELMLFKHENARLKALLDNKSKTESELCGSDTQIQHLGRSDQSGQDIQQHTSPNL